MSSFGTNCFESENDDVFLCCEKGVVITAVEQIGATERGDKWCDNCENLNKGRLGRIILCEY